MSYELSTYISQQLHPCYIRSDALIPFNRDRPHGLWMMPPWFQKTPHLYHGFILQLPSRCNYPITHIWTCCDIVDADINPPLTARPHVVCMGPAGQAIQQRTSSTAARMTLWMCRVGRHAHRFPSARLLATPSPGIHVLHSNLLTLIGHVMP